MSELFDGYTLGGILFVAGWLLLGWGVKQVLQRSTVIREPAVIVRHARAQSRVIALDAVKAEAVEALVRDGWKRKAAVSALASTGWHGYPSVPDMVLNAWKTMPGYRA